MILEGSVWVFGDNIDTDAIIPARYLTTTDPVELACHCMEDANPDFARKVSPGDMVVAGANFGCGSSREHAPLSLKGAGVSCVVATSFARIFYRNAINIGLPILECPDRLNQAINTGEKMKIDLERGQIIVPANGQVFQAVPFPTFMQDLIRRGGLIEYTRSRLQRE